MFRKIFIKLYHKPLVYFVNHLKVRRLNSKSKKIINAYIAIGGEKKLQIGCGKNILKGWLNTDLMYSKNKVAYLDAGKKFPLPDRSFDYIYSEHIFEHLTFTQGLNMLKECHRVLKPGGHLRLATPDLKFLIKLYDEPEKDIHQQYIHWSTSKYVHEVARHLGEEEYMPAFVVNNFFRDWNHQLIYDFESLALLLQKTGFGNIRNQAVGVSDSPVFKNLEKHGEIIPETFNELETLVVECTK